MDKIKNKKIQYLNSPLELALRILFIMVKNGEKEFDIQELAYYDYVITRLNDFDKNYDSIHRENPYKYGEVLAKNKIIKKSINILLKKDLVMIMFTKKGVKYKANPYSENIVKMFSSTYSQKLLSNIENAREYLDSIDTDKLELKFKSMIKSASKEFPNEALLRGGIDEITISN